MKLERTLVFPVLDARREVRWKDLEDYAREHDTPEVLDDFPYQKVAFDDGVVRDYNFAAQFRPKFIPAAETNENFGLGVAYLNKGLRRGKYEILEKLGQFSFFH